jgi:hypothetical protein
MSFWKILRAKETVSLEFSEGDNVWVVNDLKGGSEARRLNL